MCSYAAQIGLRPKEKGPSPADGRDRESRKVVKFKDLSSLRLPAPSSAVLLPFVSLQSTGFAQFDTGHMRAVVLLSTPGD